MIEAEGLCKTYGERDVLRNVSLLVKKGEILSIIGPSGTGKSTLLRILDLIEEPTAGSLRIFGKTVSDTSARFSVRRKMGILFQKPVIFNTLVKENVALGLRYRQIEEAVIKERVEEALEQVGLSGYGERKARTLSGGESQRLALARALVTEPEILFLDEPTAYLDPRTADSIEALINALNGDYGITLVIATHDLFQGQRISDRIAVMMEGELSQVGAPEEIFQAPHSREVARYVGVENILPGTVIENKDGATSITVDGLRFMAISSYRQGERVWVCFRGEAVTLDLEEHSHSSARNIFRGTIRRLVLEGPLIHVKVDCGIEIASLLTRNAVEELRLVPGMEVMVSVKAAAIHILPSDNAPVR